MEEEEEEEEEKEKEEEEESKQILKKETLLWAWRGVGSVRGLTKNAWACYSIM